MELILRVHRGPGEDLLRILEWVLVRWLPRGISVEDVLLWLVEAGALRNTYLSEGQDM